MMRVADVIADFIYAQEVEHVFMVTGGGMMFLSDGVAAHPDLKAICTHHEQAAAMAAVSYAKYNGKMGACYVTTGCGGTNAVTGLLNGWQDSTPCLFVSGQVKRKETSRLSSAHLRQFGVQEADIIRIVESLTKYAVMIEDPESILYHLEKACFLAKSGRPGPVWIDVPLDVQGAMVDPDKMTHYEPEACHDVAAIQADDLSTVADMLSQAERPIIVAGQGIRLGNTEAAFRDFVESTGLPVVATKLAVDILPTDHPLFIGRIGNKGDRAGNMAVQNADMVLVLGARLSVSSTGHEYDKFAREAKIVVVDVDKEEHKKNTVRIDLFIEGSVQDFLSKDLWDTEGERTREPWLEHCRNWRSKYPVCLPSYKEEKDGVNLYEFVNVLSNLMPDAAVVVSDAGSAFYVTTQACRFRDGQRSVTTGGQAEMGYSLPAAIGVCLAKGTQDVIVITGDGSLQMNIQELQTVLHHKLPVKLFVWNNDGYLSIRASQRKFFDERYIGTDDTCGVSFPDLCKVSDAYGIPFLRIGSTEELETGIQAALDKDGPVVCEVICVRDQEIIPTAASVRKDDGTMVSRPLEDMYPFLDREEFKNEMIIEPLSE